MCLSIPAGVCAPLHVQALMVLHMLIGSAAHLPSSQRKGETCFNKQSLQRSGERKPFFPPTLLRGQPSECPYETTHKRTPMCRTRVTSS